MKAAAWYDWNAGSYVCGSIRRNKKVLHIDDKIALFPISYDIARNVYNWLLS